MMAGVSSGRALIRDQCRSLFAHLVQAENPFGTRKQVIHVFLKTLAWANEAWLHWLQKLRVQETL